MFQKDIIPISPGTQFAKPNHMAYLPRYAIIWDGAVFHVTWQCHNHSWLLKYDWAKQLYYDLLLKYKDRYKVCFYSYHFMDNHIHLSGKILGTKEEFSTLFKIVNSRLAKEINKQLKRKGQVVMDRFKSPCIQSDRALLAVMTYQDLNSYRAKKVPHPKDYRWSSYHFYAYGKIDPLLTPAPPYLAMGNTDQERQQAYRKLVEEILQNEGFKKKDYSRRCYIGDPNWVIRRSKELKIIMQAKRQAYLLRRWRQFNASSP